MVRAVHAAAIDAGTGKLSLKSPQSRQSAWWVIGGFLLFADSSSKVAKASALGVWQFKGSRGKIG